jgi:membrane-bound lytic murein transglycosylase D
MSGKWISLLLIGFLLFACGTSNKVVKLESKGGFEKIPDPVSAELDSARIYVEMGKNAEKHGDSLSAEIYFERAMDLSTQFQKRFLTNIDSVDQAIIEEVSLAYSQFLARINGLEKDSLTAANVMEILNELDESISYEDTVQEFVTIEDVIQEQKELAIPLVLNKKVENAMDYFKGRGRRVFTRWLQRTGWYKDLIIRILREEGVPEELFYLAMIESGFNPHARSYARAVGIWQFIYGTGKAYGLERSWWFDERRDPEKSTRAAARHLKDLYVRFENWYLAIAGYNFSPAKIERRMRKYNVVEFWDLPRLPRQTRNYVPTFIAAVHLAENPEKHGFYVKPEEPVVYDTVKVFECVDLNVVAQCVNSSFKEIKRLNPALIRWCTPPDRKSWVLNIPKDTREEFIKNYEQIPDEKKLTYVHHRVRRGETLSHISRKYGVNIYEIKRFNRIRGTLIREGQYLVIPYPQNKQYARALVREAKRTYPTYNRRRKPVENVAGREKFVHVVSIGETLWDIATFYGVSISEIRYWNGLSSSRIIHPEQELNIWLPGDVKSIRTADKNPEQKAVESVTGNGETITYTVRHGDTLWDIASNYGVSIKDIKLWNNRRSNLIKPGDQLTIIKNQE